MYTNTVYGKCARCGHSLLGGHYCPQIEVQPFPAPLFGWTCPKCGRGNSPHTIVCPCIPLDNKVSC